MTAYADKCTDDYGVACIRKFDDPTSAFSMTGSTHDIILARLGETYLVAAEAYVKLNQPDKAKVKINELRERATEADYDLSVQESDDRRTRHRLYSGRTRVSWQENITVGWT